MEVILKDSAKAQRALKAVTKPNTIRYEDSDNSGFNKPAELVLAEQVKKDNPKLSEEEMVLEVYKGLGGIVATKDKDGKTTILEETRTENNVQKKEGTPDGKGGMVLKVKKAGKAEQDIREM